jgi:hypothetical protein
VCLYREGRGVSAPQPTSGVVVTRQLSCSPLHVKERGSEEGESDAWTA